MEPIEVKIAQKVRACGGRTFFVGGYVRDKLRHCPSKDVDIEIHGISPENLLSLLSEWGEVLSYGSNFGIYSLRGYHLDIAMPRREKATGRGHRDFEVFVDPFVGVREAARRRDFTINAIMEDVLTGEIEDPFGGRIDLEAGVLRHVDDDSFIEDPLRVLRAAQFAARFGFTVAPETVALCRRMNTAPLSPERVEEEVKKALLRGQKPSIFFETLREMDQLSPWFEELKPLVGLEQNPAFHPEGDVWIHTMDVLDRAAAFREKVSDPFSFMLLALTHDLGKILTTEKIRGTIHAYGHETAGLPLTKALLQRITREKAVLEYVLNMVPLHMKPNQTASARSSVKVTNRMFDQAVSPEDLVWFFLADRPVLSGETPFSGDGDFLFQRCALYREMMARPFVTGQDLVDAGLKPGAYFSELLSFSHKLRLAGIPKESALKQTLSYARKRK